MIQQTETDMKTLTVNTVKNLTSIFNSNTQTFKIGDKVRVYDSLKKSPVKDATIINLGFSICGLIDSNGVYFENTLITSIKLLSK